MITIYRPTIIETKTVTRLQATFEVDGVKENLWYEVDKKFGNYFTHERADAFVVGLLWYGIVMGHNMKVLSPMSARLHYSLNQHLIPVLATLNKNYHKVNVICNELATEPLANAGAVGTGLSCGIDSFSTISDHIGNHELQHYEITHFTFFNLGSLGTSNTDNAQKLFEGITTRAKSCASELGKEFITVNSNLSEILSMISFSGSHTLRNMSAVLALQKLFHTYYYSSGVPINNFKLTRKGGMGYYDIFTLSMLCTESLSLFSTCTTMNRVHKTRMVANFEPSYKYLHVCVFDSFNCGECMKCLRTLLTLEVVGALDKYKHLFNMDAYYRRREKYIKDVIALRNKNILLREIYNEMVRTNFNP